MDSLINSICQFSSHQGLPALALSTLVDLITLPSQLDQASVRALVKGLYPAARVSSDVVCRVVNSLGQGGQKTQPSTQNSLLKWLALVYDVLEDPSVLARLYNVLFNLLDMLSIRSSAL